jgi:integrase/recombinase XerD
VKIATGSQREVDVLSEAQVNRLLFHIQDRAKVTQRNELIIHLLLYTGVRVSELCSIKIKDVDVITNTLNVFGKGGKHREIPIKVELLEKIQGYIKGERNESRFKESEWLLVSQRTERLARDAVNTILEQVAQHLDVRLYPHLFRHTFCTRLIQRGVDITTVSRLAGHSSVTTTSEYYVNTSRQEKQLAVNLL